MTRSYRIEARDALTDRMVVGAKVAFSRTEAFQQLKDKRDVTSTDALTDVFKVLTDHGYIRPMDPTGTGRPGPVPEVYAVNPLWKRT